MINEIQHFLIENNKTLSVCESITGGALSSKLISKAGSSNFFQGSVVVYNDEIKSKILGIDINKIKEAIIIEGPDDVLNSKDENSPNNTDNNPPIIENITIFWGLSEIFLAIAAGIISIPVISNNPTILIDMAITAAIRIVKIAFALSGFNPSASANS